MLGASWATAALVCLHLGSLGALPPEVQQEAVRPYLNGEKPVRVLIANDCRSVRLRPDEAVAVEDPQTGNRLAVVQAKAALTAAPVSAGVRLSGRGLSVTRPRLRLVPAGRDGATTISVTGGWGRRGVYPGAIEIADNPGGLSVIEHVSLETYISGVVASEMPASFPLEAAKAQAIAARTYSLYHLGGHDADDADLCAQVHCQAYAGLPGASTVAARATAATAGQVLVWNGLLVDALYHSACGGRTATAWEVRQGKLLPYLRGEPDSAGGAAYCATGHDVSWSKRFSASEADHLVTANLGRVSGRPGLAPGRLETFQLTDTPGGDRVQWLKVYTDRGAYRVRGDATRWLFGTGRPGPQGLRSTAYDLTVEPGPGGRPAAFVFTGRGHGHGLGLCQWGARGRALAGQTADAILSAYYPGARVVDLSR